MAASKKKLLAKVTSMSASLDELEAKLEPLFAQPLQDTITSLDSLQQAKLHVVLPYLINDLIFIYLRTRGVDPKTHPVVAELDRVRQYFSKIKDAEEAGKKKATAIDKAAAGRFIKHAIAQARQSAEKSNDNPVEHNEAGPSQPSSSVPVRVTEKMRERERYLKELKDESGSEEADLEIIEDALDDEDSGSTLLKGKQVANATLPDLLEPRPTQKKRRRPVDPFGSFGDAPGGGADNAQSAPKKRSKKLAAFAESDAVNSSRASSVVSDVIHAEGKSKKRKKKTASSRPKRD